MLLVLTVSTALGGAGPWVVGPGQGTVFLGLESQRLTRLAIVEDGERSVIDVGEGLSTVGGKAIGTVGLTRRLELQGELPLVHVRANREDAPVCAALGEEVGLEACEPTTSLGVLEVRGKGLLADEFFGAPVSLAIGAELRAGQHTLATRERLTNVGEGTLDAGVFLTVGRTGALGERGYWSGWLEVLGRYRVPVRRDFPASLGDRPVPGSELGFAGEWVVAPQGRVALGPAFVGLWRPAGVDWGEVDLADRDRFGALRVLNVRAGGTVVVRGPGTVAATASVLHTVASRNNPNVTTVSVGVQTLLRRARRVDDER